MGPIPRRIGGDRPLSDSVLEARKGVRLPVIVDIKPVSPRDGDLLKRRKPADLARMAEQAGACAVSVVTESSRFGGSMDMLREVAGACSLPVLQKDFFTTPEQVAESCAAGAASFLIILSTVSDTTAQTLYRCGRQLGLEPVVEIHTAAELKRALPLNPTIIGINNRDIARLELDAGDVRVTEKLAPAVPEDIVILSESALQSCDDVQRAFSAGAHAVLIGTAILRSGDFTSNLKNLMRGQTDRI